MSQTKTDTASDTGLMRVPSERISRLMDLVAELSLSVAETVRSPIWTGWSCRISKPLSTG